MLETTDILKSNNVEKFWPFSKNNQTIVTVYTKFIVI